MVQTQIINLPLDTRGCDPQTSGPPGRGYDHHIRPNIIIEFEHIPIITLLHDQ